MTRIFSREGTRVKTGAFRGPLCGSIALHGSRKRKSFGSVYLLKLLNAWRRRAFRHADMPIMRYRKLQHFDPA